MEQVWECRKCGLHQKEAVAVPQTVEEERERIAELLSDSPMGIGGGTLTKRQIQLLLLAVFYA